MAMLYRLLLRYTRVMQRCTRAYWARRARDMMQVSSKVPQRSYKGSRRIGVCYLTGVSILSTRPVSHGKWYTKRQARGYVSGVLKGPAFKVPSILLGIVPLMFDLIYLYRQQEISGPSFAGRYGCDFHSEQKRNKSHEILASRLKGKPTLQFPIKTT